MGHRLHLHGLHRIWNDMRALGRVIIITFLLLFIAAPILVPGLHIVDWLLPRTPAGSTVMWGAITYWYVRRRVRAYRARMAEQREQTTARFEAAYQRGKDSAFDGLEGYPSP